MAQQPETNTIDEPRCPECGYTKQDALIHWDHWRCKGKIPGYDVTWFDSKDALPDAGVDVAVRGSDTQGKWAIAGGVCWLPYKGKPHSQGRWIQKNESGVWNRLPESDEVEEWSHI